MKAFITRDSVSAGDDMDPPHGRTVTVPATKASEDTYATLGCRLSDCDVRDNVVRLHFSYLAQVDPDVAFEVIRRLRLTARD